MKTKKRNRLTIVEVGTLHKHLQLNPCYWRVMKNKLTSGRLTSSQLSICQSSVQKPHYYQFSFATHQAKSIARKIVVIIFWPSFDLTSSRISWRPNQHFGGDIFLSQCRVPSCPDLLSLTNSLGLVDCSSSLGPCLRQRRPFPKWWRYSHVTISSDAVI